MKFTLQRQLQGKDSIKSVTLGRKKSDKEVPARPKASWISRLAQRIYRLVKPQKIQTTPEELQSASINTIEASQTRSIHSNTVPSIASSSHHSNPKMIDTNANRDVEKAIRNKQDPSKHNFFSNYRLLRPLNEGTFSKVYLAHHKATGITVAVKKVERELVKDDLRRTFLEIEALKVLDHPNICKLYQVFETKRYVLLVLEKCAEDLFDLIHKHKRVKENKAKGIFHQIISAVAYIHSKGFAHRDLKPENVLFDCNGNVKLIDFNLCARIFCTPVMGWNKLKTHCGTIEYAAPELIVRPDEPYEGKPVDSWSLGVVLFTTLCGKFPFEEPDRKAKILYGVYKLPSHLSKEAKDLIKRLLQDNPKMRLSPSEMLQHAWLNTNKKQRPIGLEEIPKTRSEGYLDPSIVQIISTQLSIPIPDLQQILLSKHKWCYSNETALYNILTRRKQLLGEERFEEWRFTWEKDREDQGLAKGGSKRTIINGSKMSLPSSTTSNTTTTNCNQK